MAKEKKKMNLFLKILLWILGILIGAAALIALANVICTSIVMKQAKSVDAVFTEDRLTPAIDDATGFYTFTTDRELKVVQLTDTHLGCGFLSLASDKQMLKTVETMLRAEKPDLVIVTGDAFFPVPESGTFNNANELKVFSTMMNNLGIYWAFTFGNHDCQAMAYLDEAALAQRLEECGEYCLFQRGSESLSGEGNYAINVKNSDGVITRSFILLDSHSYPADDAWGFKGEYDNIHPDQIEWYKSTVNILTDLNKQAIASVADAAKRSEYSKRFNIVPSFLFFHIPLAEYKTAWENYEKNGYRDTFDTKYVYGYMGETEAPYIFCGAGDDDMFEAVLDYGSTQAIFCGHDHTNNFSFEYMGVRLSYGMSCDCFVYKGIKNLGSQRGCTVITCGADGSFEITPENYYQEKYDFEGKESVSMQPLNEEQEKAQKNG
ncbi:MAG: metallophosphoesterase [Clostridia bacterium]|nr:metallophosphoesterase [Clostridia bacterium]